MLSIKKFIIKITDHIIFWKSQKLALFRCSFLFIFMPRDRADWDFLISTDCKQNMSSDSWCMHVVASGFLPLMKTSLLWGIFLQMDIYSYFSNDCATNHDQNQSMVWLCCRNFNTFDFIDDLRYLSTHKTTPTVYLMAKGDFLIWVETNGHETNVTPVQLW